MSALDRFVSRCAASVDDGSFATLLLSKHRGPEPDLQRVRIRSVIVREQPCLSFVYHHTARDVTKNLPLPSALRTVRELMGPVFRNAHLHTRAETVELAISQRGVCTLRSSPAR
ncbi:MAG: methyltransferase, partial [Burkholderiaceae bacterium]|nr:methyltransferase [Burkholderiaceae bacterium]